MADKKGKTIWRGGKRVGRTAGEAGSTIGAGSAPIPGAAGDEFVAPEMKSGENALTPAYRTRVRKARKAFNAAKDTAGPTTKDAAKALRRPRKGTY